MYAPESSIADSDISYLIFHRHKASMWSNFASLLAPKLNMDWVDWGTAEGLHFEVGEKGIAPRAGVSALSEELFATSRSLYPLSPWQTE